GRTIMRQGERADRLFVILSGRVRVLEPADDRSRVEIVVAELGPGEIAGELAILADIPRSANVVAVEPTRCIALPAAEFSRLLDTTPGLAAAVTRVLARRISETDERLARQTPDVLTGLLS